MKSCYKFICLILFFGLTQKSECQSIGIDSLKNEIKRINYLFDNASFFGFDVNVTLRSDTLLGRFENDDKEVQYVVNGNNLYYNVGDIEFMQNDSLTVTIYGEDQIMHVTQEKLTNNSSTLPLKYFADSVLAYYASNYSYTLSNNDSIKTITFVSDSTKFPYQKYTIQYSAGSYLLQNMSYEYREPLTSIDYGVVDSLVNPEVAAAITNTKVKKRMTMKFTNYHFIENTDVFDQLNYLSFDRQRRVYEAAGKYKGYRIFGGDFTNPDLEYNDVEIPAPPGKPKP